MTETDEADDAVDAMESILDVEAIEDDESVLSIGDAAAFCVRSFSGY